MSSAVAVVDRADTAVAEPFIDSERRALIRRTVARDASDLEFEFFIAYAEARRLDPLLNQICLVKRGGVAKPQVQIDGLRLVADRTRRYVGSDPASYDTEDETHPNRATVTVWKWEGGQRHPFTATVRWVEFCPKEARDRFNWDRMPYHMLGKVAEAHALRKAFPAETSGLYTDDEMAQVGTVIEATGMVRSGAPTPLRQVDGGRVDEATGEFWPVSESESETTPSETVVTTVDLRRLHAVGKDRKLIHADLHALAFAWFKRRSVKELTPKEMDRLCADVANLDEEALASELHVAYGWIEAEKANATQETTEAAPQTSPLLHWDGLWTFCEASGVPTGKAKLEEWLGEPVTTLTPQQAKELVELRLRERAELGQSAEKF